VLIGNSLTGFEDLWEWTGTRWVARAFVTPLADAYRAAIAYDPIAHALVVFGGRPGGATRLVAYRPHVATEACTLATLDYDGDGKPGCMDEDCWGSCTPLCEPGMTCAPALPRCGDGACDAFETCGLCPGDCPCPPADVCGDFVCDGSETLATCPADCP
jgi:hypothetical protein